MIKYTNRGLVNDRYYWNMNWSLLKSLFWVSNTAFLMVNQGRGLAYLIKHGHSIYGNTYRWYHDTMKQWWQPLNADMFRTQLCKLIENHPQFEHSKEAYENPHSLRFGNLVMKNVLVVVIIILSIGVYWKQRHQKNPMRVSGNFNVITLKQTVIFLILISFDNTCLSYVICWDNFFGMSEDVVFVLEMLRVILVENIFFKFCVPLYFLIDSKTKLPSLWAERDDRRLNFFMTAQEIRPCKDL